jgi:glucosamine--fructose-6-phosphate aminotransferase (isomerizing)
MCGIVGYIGKNQAKDFLLNGLETLEYRGYDSAGIACLDSSITCVKVAGRVEQLRQAVEDNPAIGSLGIGHTRWATHGTPVQKNAHPQWDNSEEFYVVHNGIIENYQEIKDFLTNKGVIFHSDTDTEVIPNLIAHLYKENGSKNVEKAFKTALKSLRGAYAVVMISAHDVDHMYVAKLSSPLAIGVGKDEMFIGSDAIPIIPYAQQIVFLEDNEGAVITNKGYKIFNIATDESIERPSELIEIEQEAAEKGEFPDFMLKEIHEVAKTVRSSMLGRLKADDGIIKLGGLAEVRDQLDYIDRIIILACGTSYYAGLVGEYLLEEIAGIPVEVQQSSEFRYRDEPLSRSTAVLVVSQSGETADTIAALKKLKGSGILTLGIVNSPGSTLARMTDAGVYCHAGPEKAVASTKAFVAQVTVFILVALHLSRTFKNYKSLLSELESLPQKMEQVLLQEKTIQKLAEKYSKYSDFLYVGRRYAYPLALEGALKLKEISYIHAEGFAGGELKHGPLALVDKEFPTFAVALSNSISEKTYSNLQEIHTRGGKILAVVDDENSPAAKLADDIIVVPKVSEQLQPLIGVIPMFLFAYYAARKLGRDIDKPRNLAKSVTVE